jgi:hypothetical protein
MLKIGHKTVVIKSEEKRALANPCIEAEESFKME